MMDEKKKRLEQILKKAKEGYDTQLEHTGVRPAWENTQKSSVPTGSLPNIDNPDDPFGDTETRRRIPELNSEQQKATNRGLGGTSNIEDKDYIKFSKKVEDDKLLNITRKARGQKTQLSPEELTEDIGDRRMTPKLEDKFKEYKQLKSLNKKKALKNALKSLGSTALKGIGPAAAAYTLADLSKEGNIHGMVDKALSSVSSETASPELSEMKIDPVQQEIQETKKLGRLGYIEPELKERRLRQLLEKLKNK